jgi:hypothetical protein
MMYRRIRIRRIPIHVSVSMLPRFGMQHSVLTVKIGGFNVQNVAKLPVWFTFFFS